MVICFPRFPFCLCVAIAKSKGRLWASICFPRFWVGLTLALLLRRLQQQRKRAAATKAKGPHLLFISFQMQMQKRQKFISFQMFLFVAFASRRRPRGLQIRIKQNATEAKAGEANGAPRQRQIIIQSWSSQAREVRIKTKCKRGNVSVQGSNCLFSITNIRDMQNVLLPLLDNYNLFTTKWLDNLDFKLVVNFLSSANTTRVSNKN